MNVHEVRNLEPIEWEPVYFEMGLGGLHEEAIVQVRGNEISTRLVDYRRGVRPERVKTEIAHVPEDQRGSGKRTLDTIVGLHLAQLDMLHSLGRYAALEATTYSQLQRPYAAMTTGELVRPAGSRPKQAWQLAFASAYPNAFRLKMIEYGMISVISTFADRVPGHERALAGLHVPRMQAMTAHGAVAADLPATRDFINSVHKGGHIHAAALSELAGELDNEMRGLLGTTDPIRRESSGINGADRLTELSHSELRFLEAKIINHEVNADSGSLLFSSMAAVDLILSTAAESGIKNARIIKKTLDHFRRLDSRKKLPDSFIATANQITKSFADNHSETPLANYPELDAFHTPDLARAVDVIMCAAFSALKDDKQRERYQLMGNMASLFAVMASQGADLLTDNDLAVRYWNYPESKREQLIGAAELGTDEIALHAQLLDVPTPR